MKAKKLLSILLAIAMVISIMPSFAVFAEDTAEAITEEITDEVIEAVAEEAVDETIELSASTSYFGLEFDGNDTATGYHWAYDNDTVTPITLTPETDGTVKLTGEIFANASGVARQPVIAFDTPISVSGKTDTVLEVRMKIDAGKDDASNSTINFGKQILSMVKNGNYHADAWIVSGKLGYGGGNQNAAGNRAISTDYEIKDNAWYTYYVHLNTAGKVTRTDAVGDDGTSFTGGANAAMSYNGTVETINYLYFPFSENVISTVDYVRIYDATTLPAPVATYESAALDGATDMPTEFTATVTFENAITEAQMAFVTVDNDATVTKTLSEDGKTVTLALSNLEPSTKYTVSSPIMAMNNAFSASFTTVIEVPEWYLLKLDFEGADSEYGTWKTDNGNNYTLSLNGDGTTSFAGTGGRSPRLVLSQALDMTDISTVMVESRMKISSSTSRGIFFIGDMGTINAGFKVTNGELKYGNGSLNDKDDMNATGYTMPLNTWFKVIMEIDYANNKQKITIIPEDGTAAYYGDFRTYTYNLNKTLPMTNIQFAFAGQCTQTVDYFYILDPAKQPTPTLTYNDAALDGALGTPKAFDATITFTEAVTQADVDKITVDNGGTVTVALAEDGLSATLSFTDLAARTPYVLSVPGIGAHAATSARFITTNEDWYLYQAEFDGNDGYIGTKTTGTIADGVLTMTPAYANTYLQFDLSENPVDLTAGGNYVAETRVMYNQYETDDTDDTVTPNGNLSSEKVIFSLINNASTSRQSLWATSGTLVTGGLGTKPAVNTEATIVENKWYTIRYTNFANRNAYHVNIKDDDGNVVYDGDASYNGYALSAINRIEYSYRANMGTTIDYMRIWDADLLPSATAAIGETDLGDVRRASKGDVITISFPEAVTEAEISGKIKLNGNAVDASLASDGLSATVTLSDLTERTFYTLTIDAPKDTINGNEYTFRSADAGRYMLNAQFDGSDDDSVFFRQYTDRSVTPAVTKYANFTNTHSWINDGVIWNNFTDQYLSFRFDNYDYVESGLSDNEEVVITAKFKLEPGTSGSTARKEFFRVANIGMVGIYDSDGDGMKELTYGEAGSSKGKNFMVYEDMYELENGEWYLLSFNLNFVSQTYSVSLEKEGSGNPVNSGPLSMNTTFTTATKTGIPYITTAYYAGNSYAKISFDSLVIEDTQYGKADVTFNDGAKLEHTSVMPVRDNIIDVTLVDDATTVEGITIKDLEGNDVALQAVANGNVISIVPADFEYDTTYILNLPKEVLGSEQNQTIEFATIYDETATFTYPAGFEADKFTSDNKLNVVYFGGSITAQNGWRVVSTNWFKEKYGAENVNAVNASYGGTGTGYGYFRLGRDVVSQNPDIVFIEFTTNDAVNLSRGNTMESIVRALQSLEKPPVIIFVHTMRQDLGRNTGAVEEFNEIARNYGIPVINIRDYVQGLYRTDADFADMWDTLGDNGYITTDATHPNSNGDALYGNYVNAVMEANSAKYFVYSKKSTPIKNSTDFVYDFVNVDNENLTTAGDTYTTTITGDKFIFDIVRSKTSGKFSVTVDGEVKLASVDAYSTSSTPMPTYSVSGLGEGEHTVVFTVLEDKNASSTGNNVNIKSIFTVPAEYEINFSQPVFDASEVVVGTPLTATVTYNTEKATPFSLIIVLYDEDGKVTAMNATTSTTDTSNEEKTASVYLTPVAGDVKAKVFIWDALTGMEPFAPCNSIGF